MTFEKLNLIPQILHSLKAKGYTVPTPIQQKAIPYILEGRDIFGSAQTGTGKTAAFAVPVLQTLFTSKAHQRKGIKALILAPTRELAQQISDSFRDYGKGLQLRHTVVYGGVSQRGQTDALRSGIDILIATPGRLIDLMDQGYIHLDAVEFFILDEVDRMLDMGFINDIKKLITKLPKKKQTLFFSATVPVTIKKLSDSLLQNPAIVETARVSSTSVNIKQYVYFVSKEYKRSLLKDILEKADKPHVLVFTRTKRGADRLVKNLAADGVKGEAIHGDKSQGARNRALERFKNRSISLLVATDVASRGLDITDITHVINYDLPEEAEVYVHRIGRTGRAGATGTAISFCAPDEKHMMKDINKLSGDQIETVATPTLKISDAPRPAHQGQSHGHRSGNNHPRERVFSASERGQGHRRNGNAGRPASGNGERRHSGSRDGNSNSSGRHSSSQGEKHASERKPATPQRTWSGGWQSRNNPARPLD